MSNILICGANGYIGWPLASRLHADARHRVVMLDDLSKTVFECRIGRTSRPVGGIASWIKRTQLLGDRGHNIDLSCYGQYSKLVKLLIKEEIDVVVHLAEQPSAPYSMLSVDTACETQQRNILGTLRLIWAIRESGRDIHVVKLGTMGEYGTPGCPIPEGWIGMGYHDGAPVRLPFPKQPGSWYHASKVCDSVNLEMASRLWGLRVTDINQGVVWGSSTTECPFDNLLLRTAFHCDEVFGTVINRFCMQTALNLPRTVFGVGGQTRGFINLVDSIECLTLAIENAPEQGEFRVFNQLGQLLSVNEIASMFTTGETIHVKNPRLEKERHFYHVECEGLRKLGYINPILLTAGHLLSIISDLNTVDLTDYKSMLERETRGHFVAKWEK